MSPSLLSLQPEVHLAIVDALGPDYTGLRNEDIEGMYGENGGRARSRRSRLQDRQTQSRRNLFSWSCISKYFRALLAPRIFNALILRNEEKSGDSVEAIATHPEYGNHVREIQFIGYAPGDAKRDDPAFKDTKHVLPHNVASILSDLKRFPKLQTLGVGFDLDFEDYNEWDVEGVNPLAEAEVEAQVRHKEGEEAWRALMAKVWEAVCFNEKSVVKKLAINRLYYREVSTFTTSAFHDLLNSLEQFTISFYGGDNGAGWKTNTSEIWCAFVAKLDSFFFVHLSHTTSLALEATKEGPLGLDGMHHGPLVLRKEHTPLLKSLHLKYIILGPELRDFLVGHANMLEEVHMHNCLAETDTRLTNSGLHWADVFDALASAKPGRLRALLITEDCPAPLSNEVGYSNNFYSKIDEKDEEKVDKEIEEAEKAVEEGKGRVWPHVTLDDKYGWLFEDEEENFISFREGNDQRAFERLMDIVRKNNSGDQEVAGDGKEFGKRDDVRGPAPERW